MGWDKEFDIESSDDPMARLVKDLEELKDYHFGITQLLPRVLTTLKKERAEIFHDAERRFTDIWNRIDKFQEGDEDCWLTALRIFDHYERTYKPENR